MKKIYQWLLMGTLMVLTFCLGITTYAESKTSQAGITFTGDGSIEVSVLLQKKDKETNKLLSNATFELRNEKGETVEVAQSMTTDAKGEIHLTRLVPGKYTFVETKSPKGYRLDQTPIPFEVAFDQTSVKVTAYNEKSKKSGEITPAESTNKNQSISSKDSVVQKAKGIFPKTGNKSSSVWIIIGLFILVSAIYEMYRKYITK
ncbi:SpaA isopeptide-forming pilin-related protein [Enterococcus faecalis]|uniref:MSCRAMM family protein n=1 Tax=Enterococcus faecalis TaxID=1351 RepID=UPI0021CAADA1|nr:SpaA isopeptide-forming pilin-related protein [Enterococcus faecalis]MCU2243126.1 SpaA isopeptide-forming pilin-related protein [Enterococcus faecalis]